VADDREQLYDLSDARLDSFEVRDGRLTVRIHTWNDQLSVFVADSVDYISYTEVAGVAAVIRIRSLDQGDRRGYGIEADDLKTAITFRAASFEPDLEATDTTPRISPHIRRIGRDG
jgi:hypothetical protein